MTTAVPRRTRRVFAAAHVVGDGPRIDWDATLAFRHHLWAHGLGVADAMDTAQRGAGLDWPAARELICRTASEASGDLVVGVGTDQLPPGPATLPDIVAAYEEQLAVAVEAGVQPVLMCSRALADTARGADDYSFVYGRLLDQLDGTALLHWLGPMFDPALAGYWGSSDLDQATASVLELINAHVGKVDGIKISLLDAEREVAIRRSLPVGVRLYTGDDYNYPDLIAGDADGHSDALLGVFDPLAPVAAAALRCLDEGDLAGFHARLDPTVELARHLFAAPTQHYKTGVVFLAWLNGHQDRFTMLANAQTLRSREHLAELARLAGSAGVLTRPDRAAALGREYLGGAA